MEMGALTGTGASRCFLRHLQERRARAISAPTSMLSLESGCPDRPPLFLLIGGCHLARAAARRNNPVLTFDLNEKRFIKETGLEQRIAAIVEPVANDL